MIKHIVLVNFKPSASPQQVAGVLEAARRSLSPIPGVGNLACGTALALRGEPKYKYAIVMDFKDEAALNVYREHPEHVKFAREVMRPLAEETLILDYTY